LLSKINKPSFSYSIRACPINPFERMAI